MSRPRPQVIIPLNVSPSSNPSFSDHDPPLSPINLWADRRHSSHTPLTPTATSSYLNQRSSLDVPGRSPNRPASAYEGDIGRISFPEPQLFRSSSQRSTYRSISSVHTHRSTRSESVLSPESLLTPTTYTGSIHSSGDSGPPSFESTPESYVKDLSSELSTLSINSDEALGKFQRGQLPEADEQWYRLVPPAAREVLDKREVQRQSILFELVKSEKDYVSDLELVQEVFVDPLKNTLTVPENRVDTFISETFFNINQILAHHQRMLAALFDKQREQFPLVQSLTEIILDNSLIFRQDYEEYIAHYPLAEMRHRNEMRRNLRYQSFLQQCSHNPRVRRRDLNTFLSRPVTRLPRLLLILENLKKYTEPDHPDFEAIPLVVGILSDFIKSTQHGIEEAEEKVHFWTLCESLTFQRGEIIDLDLYDAARSLQYQGQLMRRYKSEMNFHWADLHIALLDNYLLLLRPDAGTGTVTRHNVVSRPIPLDYLRLASFNALPENRKEKSEEGGLGLLDRVRPRYRQMFPFTLFHAAATNSRQYTLYASSDEERRKWEEVLRHTLHMRNIRQEGNKFFNPVIINDGFFKRPEFALPYNPASSPYTGPINAVTKMYSNGVRFRAIACPSGVYIAQKDEVAFRKVLHVDNPTCLVALKEVNKFLVLHDYGLCSYSLELVARAATGMSSAQSLEASRERLATDVLFFRAGKMSNRFVVLYALKKYLGVGQLSVLEVVNKGEPGASASFRRPSNGLHSFRSLEEPISIPKDTHNLSVFNNQIVICAESKMQVADPASHRIASFPDFSQADAQNIPPMLMLKERCQKARPLGLIRCPKYDKDDKDEFLVIYDNLGCYTNQHGVPTRNCGYLRWEIKAVSYSYRGEYIILFSPEFIEIRTIQTGKLMQVIEGKDIRRVDLGLLNDGRDASTVVAWKGHSERGGVVVDTLVELVETAPLQHSNSRASEVRNEHQWADFDEL